MEGNSFGTFSLRPPGIRRGSMTFVAVIMGCIFFMVVSALLHYLSGEKRQVTQVIGMKQAEVLALSGIDWADQQLRRPAGRWYQSPFKNPDVYGKGRRSYGIKKLAPFESKENGTVTVVCEDVAAKNPLTGVLGMQQLWLLHHINVYSLGEYKGYKCLVSGRFIMSPEPALNSNSTNGAIFADPVAFGGGVAVVSLPKAIDKLKVTVVKKEVGDAVEMNDVIAVVANDDGSVREIKAPSKGTISGILVIAGEKYDGESPVASIVRSRGPGVPGADMRTLKRMVRVTRIDASPWKDFNIESLKDRRLLSNYISQLSKLFVMNFSAHEDLMQAIEANQDTPTEKTITPEDFLKKFPAHVTWTTQNRAENEFIAEFAKCFSTTNLKGLPEAITKTIWKLDHVPGNLPNDVQKAINDFGLPFGEISKSAPLRDPTFQNFPVKETDEDFSERLNIEGKNINTDEYIRSLSQLPDASRWVVFEYDSSVKESSKSESQDGKVINYQVKDKGHLTVTKIPKDYIFKDPKGKFYTRANYILEFARKYYSDKNAVIPHEEVRQVEFLDWPLPAGPGPKPTGGNGKAVWIPGNYGKPPANPTVTSVPKSTIKIAFPSGGNRDFNNKSGNPDGGKDLKTVNGIIPISDGTGGGNAGGAPETGGTSGGTPGGAPESGGTMDGNPGGGPVVGGSEGSAPGGAPVKEDSMFPTTCPPAEIPTDETLTVTPGEPGKEPTEGHFIWVTTTCGGSPPEGGESGYKTEKEGEGGASTQGQGLGQNPPGGEGNIEGNGLDSDGPPFATNANGYDSNGNPVQISGNGYDSHGNPFEVFGNGYQAEGTPGYADGSGRNTNGPDGKSTGYGKEASAPGGSKGNVISKAGPPGKSDDEKIKENGLIPCSCGGAHPPPPDPNSGGGGGGGNSSGGGGGSGEGGN